MRAMRGFWMGMTLAAGLALAGCGGAEGEDGSLPPPPPPATLGEAILAWEAPASYDDGTPLIVAGYKVYYGATPDVYGRVVDVGTDNSVSIGDLAPGTWYFTVTAYDVNGNMSNLSNAVSKVI